MSIDAAVSERRQAPDSATPRDPVARGQSDRTGTPNARSTAAATAAGGLPDLARRAAGPAASEAVARGTGEVLRSTVDSVAGGALAADANRAVAALNGDGDSATLRLTAEVKGKLQVGVKGQIGAQMQITRNGDGPDATYTVALEKHALAMVTGELPTGPLSEVLKIKGEGGVGTADRVEMTFDSPEDAARAAQIVQRLAVADAATDALPGPLGSLSGGGSNPLANPLNRDGAPGLLAQRAVGITAADQRFLADNVSAYETELSGRGRAALEAQLPQVFGPALAAEGRLDPQRNLTHRVELPRGGEPGRETIRLTAAAELSVKEKITLDPLPSNQLVAGVLVQNIADLGQAEASIEASWEVPANDDPTRSVGGGRPLPFLDRLVAGDLRGPDSVRAEMSYRHTTQSPTDLTRTDMRAATYALEARTPEAIPEAVAAFMGGDPEGAARIAGVEVSGERQEIRRSGFEHQHGAKLEIVAGNKLEVTAIIEAGIDDVVARQPLGAPPVPANDPAPPAQAEQGLVVTPRDGLNLRAAPGGEREAVLQHGTFLRQTGEAVTDAGGARWLPVSGTDRADKPVEGWVKADFVRAHDAGRGAMDGTGRTNPALENQRLDEIKVAEHDNLWDLARAHGLPFEQLAALNRDHLISPGLIFEGDTVYVPGTARGPAPEAPVAPPPPPAAAPQGSSPAAGSGASSPAPDTASGPVPGPTGPVAKAPADATTEAPAGRPDLAAIGSTYQVEGEAREPWRPKIFGAEVPDWAEGVAGGLGGLLGDAPVIGEQARRLEELAKGGLRQDFTPTEARALDELDPADLATWFGITDGVGKDALAAVPKPEGTAMDESRWINDGHVDAYRHALWNARMTQSFGEDWTAAYATGHEKVEGNLAAREAMDLWNNEVGRRIASENPGADDARLGRLVREAMDRGDLLVIDGQGALAWSDQVPLGSHGQARAGEAPGDRGFEARQLERDSRS